jgi:hypothetical protein
VHEQREKVSRLPHRVVGPGHEQVRLFFTRLFVGVVADTGRVGQQVVRRDLGRDRCVAKPEVLDHWCVEGEAADINLLKSGYGREELGDGGEIEPRVRTARDSPRRACQAIGRPECGGPVDVNAHRSEEALIEGAR